MRSFIASIFLFTIAGGAILFGDSLISNKAEITLQTMGEVRRTFRAGENLVFFPDLPIRRAALQQVAELNPVIGVEFLTRYSPPDFASPESLSRGIAQTLRSVSTLKGLEYYSASRDRMRIFFRDAYMVDSLEKGNRLSDPQTATAPDEHFFAYLDDSSAGQYVANMTYTTRDRYVAMKYENATTIRKMMLPLIRKGNLISSVIIIPDGEDLLFYGYSCVRAINWFDMVERKGEASFTNRMVALYSWFRTNLERVAAER
jgi:hypothetical protein